MLSNNYFLGAKYPQKYVVYLNFMGSQLRQVESRKCFEAGRKYLGQYGRPNSGGGGGRWRWQRSRWIPQTRGGLWAVSWKQWQDRHRLWVGIQSGDHLACLGKSYNEDIIAERIIIYPKALVNLRARVKYHKPYPSVWGYPSPNMSSMPTLPHASCPGRCYFSPLPIPTAPSSLGQAEPCISKLGSPRGDTSNHKPASKPTQGDCSAWV